MLTPRAHAGMALDASIAVALVISVRRVQFSVITCPFMPLGLNTPLGYII